MSSGRAKILFLVIFTLSGLLTGCWDRREIEERSSILAIAIDRAKGKKDLFRFTVQIPIPIKIAGSGGQGGGSSSQAVKVMVVTGRSIVDAANNLQKRLNQRIFFGHTRVIAFSEELAREGMVVLFDPIRRDPQIRRLLNPLVVKGEAAQLLKIKPKLVQMPTVYILDLLESGSKTGMIPNQTLGDVYVQYYNKAMQPFMNYVATGKDEVAWKGIAVINKSKVVGILNEAQTWVLMQLRDKKRGGDIVVHLKDKPKGYITFRPHFVRTKLKIQHKPGVPTNHQAEYACTVQGDIVEITLPPSAKESEWIPLLQKLIKQELEKRAAKLLHQLQKEYRTDILKLGLSLKAHHYRDFWEKHNWEQTFPNMSIKVTYDIRIRRLGMKAKW